MGTYWRKICRWGFPLYFQRLYRIQVWLWHRKLFYLWLFNSNGVASIHVSRGVQLTAFRNQLLWDLYWGLPYTDSELAKFKSWGNSEFHEDMKWRFIVFYRLIHLSIIVKNNIRYWYNIIWSFFNEEEY